MFLLRGRLEFLCGLLFVQHRHASEFACINAEVKRTANADFTVDGDFSAHGFGQLLADGQAQSGTAEATSDRRVCLHELLEQPSHLFFSHPDAGVLDFKSHKRSTILFDHRRHDRDAAFLSKLDCVADEVHKNLAQASRVGLNGFGNRSADANGKVQLLLFGFDSQHVDNFCHQLIRAAALNFQLQFSGFNLREVQNIVDQFHQMRTTGMNRIQIRRASRFGLFQASTQNIGEAHDRIHRIANFMAHVRKEVALGFIGGVGGVFGDLQIDLVLFQLRHIIQRNHHAANCGFVAKQGRAVHFEDSLVLQFIHKFHRHP